MKEFSAILLLIIVIVTVGYQISSNEKKGANSPMGIESIFEKERNRYVKHFIESRNQIAKETPQSVGELLISLNTEELAYPYRYLRADVISKFDNGSTKAYEVTINLDPNFEEKGFNYGSFTIEVYPFTWNSIQIAVNKPILNTTQLEGWITRWLDVEDKKLKNVDDLSEAIHSFTPIDNTGDWWYLTGDFGTAPTEALIEFIELMASQGMTRIVIKSGDE